MGFQVFVHLSWVILMFAILRVAVAEVSAAGQECRPARCSHRGPKIRFPFWIKDKQPEVCGYPGFQVFCHKGKTLLQFQYLANTSLPGTQIILSKNVSVLGINYKSQNISLKSYDIGINSKLVSTSTSLPSGPLHFGKVRCSDPSYMFDEPITVANFSSKNEYDFPFMLTSLGGITFPVQWLPGPSTTSTSELRVAPCTKLFNSFLPYYLFDDSYAFSIDWYPNCTKCEEGEYCKMKNITSIYEEAADHTTICLPADYKAMKPTRYSYDDIKKITSNFSDKLGQGGYGSVYKGQINKDIIVAVKVLSCDPKANGEDFINEVGTIGQIYHVNVVRLLGYCADGCHRALVYEFQPNHSLEKFTYSGKNQQNDFLGLKKMQEIALGIAKGIEYLHQGCTQQILHFDIKPHNILLDQNFNPKISDFGLAKLCSKDQSIVSMTMARGTIGYIAPEVFSRNFGKVSSKSDVYSFGMLLLEMVGARNNNTVGNNTEKYFPEWIFHHLEEGGEIAIEIEKEEHSNIAKKLTIVGLWCIGWHPVDRPSMKHVIHMLESEECPKMPRNPFKSSNIRSFENDLEAIDESE